MSLKGHQRKSDAMCGTSPFTRISDKRWTRRKVRVGPESDVSPLFDHLVGYRK